MDIKNSKNSDQLAEQPTFEQLMEKFQFHNDSVQYHAYIANFIAEEIRQNHKNKAKESGYFTEEFFEMDMPHESEITKMKADAEGDNALSDEAPQASESAAAMH